jgi:hypothetical protein
LTGRETQPDALSSRILAAEGAGEEDIS